jgi:hypothetical protein
MYVMDFFGLLGLWNLRFEPHLRGPGPNILELLRGSQGSITCPIGSITYTVCPLLDYITSTFMYSLFLALFPFVFPYKITGW